MAVISDMGFFYIYLKIQVKKCIRIDYESGDKVKL